MALYTLSITARTKDGAPLVSMTRDTDCRIIHRHAPIDRLRRVTIPNRVSAAAWRAAMDDLEAEVCGAVTLAADHPDDTLATDLRRARAVAALKED